MKKKMKLITLDEAIDRDIGKVGTPDRDKFEKQLKADLNRRILYVSWRFLIIGIAIISLALSIFLINNKINQNVQTNKELLSFVIQSDSLTRAVNTKQHEVVSKQLEFVRQNQSEVNEVFFNRFTRMDREIKNNSVLTFMYGEDILRLHKRQWVLIDTLELKKYFLDGSSK